MTTSGEDHILDTPRLRIRKLSEADAEFMLALLNSPKFIEFIGDRGVRTADACREFLTTRYIAGYDEHGYGLYAVELRDDSTPIGICGFVRRPTLENPDLGFAFLPEFERRGYGYESASHILGFGRDSLGFTRVDAITSLANDASGSLLQKLGFTYRQTTGAPGEEVKLYSIDL